MTENDIKKSLIAQGFSNKYIERFINIYKRSLNLNIPYPLFYTFMKLKDWQNIDKFISINNGDDDDGKQSENFITWNNLAWR